MDSAELRAKYLEFFRKRGHKIIPSASLIPENDPTTLFTSAGMQPMIAYLLGEKHPEGKRIIDSQKCFRTQDIEEVGDSRHTTFFEMLGNWSLGDYFKKEQIEWAFEFLTKEAGLDAKNIYVTVFRGKEEIGIPKDQEAVNIWKEQFEKVGIKAEAVDFAEENGMHNGKIFYYDEKKNWWSRAGVTGNMPVGEPGGPDSEMFWDFGAELKMHENSEFKDYPCHVNCDCGRFLEIGNSVFMEYIKTENGFEKLKNKNIDFGGGLERIMEAILNVQDIFLIDTFAEIRKKIEKLSGKKYGQNPEETKAFRVVLDHLRAATFLIADGALPSNKDQGYFTRRLIRRAVRFAHNIGINESFCGDVAKEVISVYADSYPRLKEKEQDIIKEFLNEEDKFNLTMERGLKEFEKLDSISGKDAFNLFQTYGFPIEITEELAKEKGIQVDIEEFKKELEKHQDLSRTASAGMFKGGLADSSEQVTKYHTATHLLLAGLRKYLGGEIYQKGSNLTAERLRLDFSYPEKVNSGKLGDVENFVNDIIKKDLPVVCEEMPIEKARELNAMGVFGEKYGTMVKVYTIADGNEIISREICGGPHVERTGVLGKFKIQKEESSSSGVRRIKAILE
jgi:alanyl-tRNA synthetase